MKAKFSTSWIRSSQARKQRKYRVNAPLHTQSHFMHATLSNDLRDKHKRRSLRVRSGDEVEVLRGSFKGKKGVVESVQVQKGRLIIRGVDNIKLDGSKAPLPVAVSNVRIVKIKEDKRRFKANDKKSS